MSAFPNLRILHKLMVAFAAVVAVIFVSSAIVYDMLRVIEAATNWRVLTTDALDTLETALDAVLDQETSVRGYLTSGDEKFLESYRKGADTTRDIRITDPMRIAPTTDPMRITDLFMDTGVTPGTAPITGIVTRTVVIDNSAVLERFLSGI